MAATTVDIPDFDFSNFYYQDIYDALIIFKRVNVPEHTDESAYDPLIQLLRANALVGHLNNAMIDLVANESTLPTAHLVESVRNMLRLIDYEMGTATPAVADIVYELSKVFAASFEVINQGALTATERTPDLDPIYFETLAAVTIDPTDEFSYVLGDEDGSFTDYTTEANSPATPGDDWVPWITPDTGDAVYFGHSHIMWDQLDLWFTQVSQGKFAEGSVTCIVKANLIDGEKFVLDDGINPAVNFWFDQTGTYVPGGGYNDLNRRVDVSGDTTDSDVAITVAAAIVAAPALNIYAAPLGGALDHIVRCQNTVGGTAGNVAITETVVDGVFAVSGMSGGNDDTLDGVWEYYDGDYAKVAPDSVDKDYSVGKLLIECNALLGISERTGITVRVQLNETTASEDVVSAWGDPDAVWGESRNYILTTGLLGQTTPSEVADDYSIGSAWSEVPDLADGTSGLTADGDVVFTLPQSVTRNWALGTVDNVEAYWIRFRVIQNGDTEVPVFQYGRLDLGKQYVLAAGTQGRSAVEDTLGSSDGSADQRFATGRDFFISGTMSIEVDGTAWLEVSNFLSSLPLDTHYTVEIGEDDRATVVFGDGVTGKIPPVGVNNVAAEYRYGADLEGNVGANTITVNKTGISYINSLWNPRQASGWAESEGADEDSLERAKIAGPASIRTREVALGPDDVIYLTQQFTDTGGARPYSRAFVVEEGFGPKTLELVLVTNGGGQATAAQITALEEYFNGDAFSHPPKVKRVVANQEVTAVNFTEKVIDITATVYGNVTQAAVENRLAQIIQPEALQTDGVTWEWDFGATVRTSRISHEIFETSENITNVVLTVPASDVVLAPRELPVLGTVSITVVS